MHMLPLDSVLPKIRVLVVLAMSLSGWQAFAQATASEAGSQLEIMRQAERATESEDWPLAARLWARAVELNPARADSWTYLAGARVRSGDYTGAIKAYEQEAVLGGRSRGDTTFDIARAYGHAGDREAALAWLRRSYDAGMRHYGTARRDAAFELLRGDPEYRELVGLVDPAARSRDERWTYDIEFYYRALRSIHLDLFTRHGREEFDHYVQTLLRDVSVLTDHEIETRLMRLSSMAGDAHTNIFPDYVFRSSRKGVQITIGDFADGYFVTHAAAAVGDLLGAEVVSIGGRPVAEVATAVGEIISHDNSMWLRRWVPHLLSFPQILSGLGIVDDPTSLPISVRAGSAARTILLPVVEESPDAWLAARSPSSGLGAGKDDDWYWFEYLPEQDAVYFDFDLVFDGPGEPLRDFLDRLLRYVDDHDVSRLILDMRDNRGGNLQLTERFIHQLGAHPRLSAEGGLYVLVGRDTFSAAMITVARIERATNAMFVGEPTGSRPNFVGETVYITLPFSGLEPSISNLYWQGSVAHDYRTWIAPHINVQETFSAFASGIDMTLNAVFGDIAARTPQR